MAAEEEWTELRLEEDPGARLDSWLAGRLELSRSRVVALIEGGNVLLNGRRPQKREVPSKGDVVRVRVPEPEPSAIEPEAIPLDVVYQDEDLLVVNKAAGMVVHPAPGHRSGTLVNALLHAVGDLSGIGGVRRPGILHRLDKDTSGLLIVAKNDLAHRALAEELKHRRIRRRYLTAAWGRLPEEEMTVDAAIGRQSTDRKRMAIVEGGRRAVTRFKRRESWWAADLLLAQLETGRTHQIRVHLLHLGHPVVGDETYGAGREKGFSGSSRAWAQELARRTPRQFLHAAELRFRHPRSGEELRFRAPLPADLRAVAEWASGSWRTESSA